MGTARTVRVPLRGVGGAGGAACATVVVVAGGVMSGVVACVIIISRRRSRGSERKGRNPRRMGGWSAGTAVAVVVSGCVSVSVVVVASAERGGRGAVESAEESV